MGRRRLGSAISRVPLTASHAGWRRAAGGQMEVHVPGRKTDVNDATWLADLLAHGLIRGSFVPDQQTQEMRDLLRTRKQLTRERSRHVQRLQKTLEDANIKLDSAISDIMGLTG